MRQFKNFFSRKQKAEPQPLRIEGIPEAPMTPEPEDAELAATAVLEAMLDGNKKNDKTKQEHPEPKDHTAAYYRKLADKIRNAHDAALLRTMRFIAFCEQELQKANLPLSGPGSLALLETELFKRIDTIERQGGELKRRWQHCLADITIRMMKAAGKTSEDTDKKQA